MNILDPPELELQVFVNHHVGNGNQTQVLRKKSILLTPEPSLQPLN